MPRFRTTREHLLTAKDEQEIERLLADALGQLAPEEVRALPPDCHHAVVNRNDVHSAAVVLLQCDLMHRGDPDIGELMRLLGELFAAASVRLSQIEHHRSPAGE